MKPNFTLRCATKLHFGVGVLDKITNYLKDFNSIMIVCGKTSARISGALGVVEKKLKELNKNYIIYDKVIPNPTRDIVNEGVELARSERVDLIIAIGGGSAIDTAKAIAITIPSNEDVWIFVKGLKIPEKTLPVIAINLTHGTGSEVDRYSVITNIETKEKIGFGYDNMYPLVSFDDPKLTLTMPKRQVIATSLDALYHALESATSLEKTPYTLLLSKEASQLIFKHLPLAINDLDNVDYRYWLLYASAIAGIAIDNSRTHLVHAMEHALSGYNPEIPHGEGLACLGPEIMKITYMYEPQILTELLKPIIPELSSKTEDAELVKTGLVRFQEDVGFRRKLSDYGISRDDIKELTELTYNSMKPLIELAPFKVDKELIKNIFLACL